jgi:hypothetical protein
MVFVSVSRLSYAVQDEDTVLRFTNGWYVLFDLYTVRFGLIRFGVVYLPCWLDHGLDFVMGFDFTYQYQLSVPFHTHRSESRRLLAVID